MEIIVKDSSTELWLNKEEEKSTILSIELLKSFEKIIFEIDKTKPLIILVPSGIAGANIKEMASMTKTEAYEYSLFGSNVLKKILEFPSIVVFAADKYLFGGGFELALTADIRIATQTCKFGFPEVSLGIIPGFGGIELSVFRFGNRGSELFLLGETYIPNDYASSVFEYELVDWKEVLEKKEKMIGRTDEISRKALRAAKQSYLEGFDFDPEKLAKNFSVLFEEYDQIEGMKAFIEKRKPKYQ